MKMRFRTKLAIALLIIGLLPVLLLGYLNYRHAYKILNKQAIEHLLSLRKDRITRLQHFFKDIRLNLRMLSDHRLFKDILTDYLAAYSKGGFDGEEFKSADKKYHKRFAKICEDYGYEDMLFVTNEGDVLVTVKKGKDWGINLVNGIYSITNLAECFNNAKNGISLVDFKEYSPSGKPAAFIGASMIRHEARKGSEAGERLGVLIIRIPVNQINAILLRDEWLGNTGEAYVIGKDLLMRSDSNFLKESAVLKVKTKALPVSEVIEGRAGYKEKETDYRGTPVSVAYGPAEIKGLDWFIVVKKDYNEIIKPVKTLRNQNLTIGLLVVFAVVMANFLLLTGLRRPVRRIKEAADKIASGDFNVRLRKYPSGEIGKLTKSINKMARKLAESSEELHAQNEELHAQNEELQAQSEELATKKNEIEKQTGQVKEASRLKSEFMSNMSHELRTPLNAILGLTSLMSDDGIVGRINEKQKEYLEVIERNGKNLLQLINDILDLSKIESGKVELFINKIYLKDFAKSVAGDIMPLVDKKGLTLSIDVEQDIFIYCDIDRLRQIFVNLLGNAVKFTKQGGIIISVMIEKGKLNDLVIIKVRDTGIGISSDALEYIFEPFRQIDGSLTREYDGTGLGLNICYNLVKLMGGNIEVESEIGKGSVFTVMLKQDRRNKLRPSEEEWRKKVRSALIQEPESADKEIERLDDNAGRILIIDDDPIVIRELGIIFKKEKYNLKFALSGSEGLKLLNTYIPDLVFLDLHMPGIDGFKVLEEIQNKDDLKNLPVLIITAADLTKDEKRNFGKNVKDVIKKGQIDKITLLALTNKLLCTRHQEAAKPINLQGPQVIEERKWPAKILVAEDRPDNLMMIKEIMNIKDYTIYTAKNGREAIDIAGKEIPDLILMDMQMPVMNGFEATKHITGMEGLKHIPIIGLTARAMKGDREEVLAAGCCDYLSKPVMPKELLRKVEQWLS